MNKRNKIIVILLFILIAVSAIISSLIFNCKEDRKIIDSQVKMENSQNDVDDVLKTIENIND